MPQATVRKIVPIPLSREATPARFVTFDGLSDGKEHVAVMYGEPEQQTAPMTRIHSECLTGDVFESQRCDCGEQLREAQTRLTDAGGIILYLRQEGRGIGLYNKLDAYTLQDEGADTYQANEMLGFDHDARDFGPAVEMLMALNITKIRLLSNNPRKVAELTKAGIDVVEHIETGVFLNRHNAAYLKAKVDQQQHRIALKDS